MTFSFMKKFFGDLRTFLVLAAGGLLSTDSVRGSMSASWYLSSALFLLVFGLGVQNN